MVVMCGDAIDGDDDDDDDARLVYHRLPHDCATSLSHDCYNNVLITGTR